MAFNYNTKSIVAIQGTNVDWILQLMQDKKTIDEKIEQQFDQIKKMMNFNDEQMADIRLCVLEMSQNGI